MHKITFKQFRAKMTAFFILIGICCFCVRETSAWPFFPFPSFLPDNPKTITFLNTPQIIKSFGYPSESHFVKTSDGFILEMHRIISGKYDSYNNKPYPVFLAHGILGSSADFFLISSEDALPFLLADRGYDVWLGNVRGNLYSSAHTELFMSNSSFWDFTFHESAIYDLPAQIDYILEHTSHSKVNYIGYSLGATLFLALTSFYPSYNAKMNVALLMAPIAYVEHTKSPVLHVLSSVSSDLEKVNELIGNREFVPDSPLIRHLTSKLCNDTFEKEQLHCNMIFMVTGFNSELYDPNVLPIVTNHLSAGYSAKAINHLSQMVQSGKFQEYDYGIWENLHRYWSRSPPSYTLSNVVTPVTLYVGQNDYLVSMDDVKTLSQQLPNLKTENIVWFPKFSHLDFLISRNVRSYVYDSLIDHLVSFSKP